MREDINTFAQRKEHAVSNMAIIVLLSHGEDGLVFGTGIFLAQLNRNVAYYNKHSGAEDMSKV